MHMFALRTFAVSLMPLLLGCASKPTAGGPGSYRGVLVGVGETGTLTVAVTGSAGGQLPASGGLVDVDGTTASLVGMLNQDSASLSLSSTTGYQLGGDSRPGYVLGGYRGPVWDGQFALLEQPDSGGSVKTFCGSYVSNTTAGASPMPFAIAAVAGGSAFCVGYNFAWLGSMDADEYVSCSVGTGLFYGNANADAGNQWGTGTEDGNSGTWSVVPCGADAGGGPDGGASGASDAPVD
ncbi:MAG: hypothetical protein WCG85_18015 [Polyangia bacterium]